MTKEELRNKIKIYIKKIFKEKIQKKEFSSGFESISKFSKLKDILNNLLTKDFIFFIKKVNWVSPKPTTFYVELKNGFGFYLIHHKNSWEAQIQGKKYHLLNNLENELATNSLSRLLRYKKPKYDKPEE